ncbi:hypothetical protein Golax_010175 [Gossypium laxum]|uniref:Uncharacterized protein n=1 Tax=Gossypium laxum TaxID=34288 RepID=A0A7J8ZHW5_9ROSI|nr:hypothetical protein [Gossypium laxum]
MRNFKGIWENATEWQWTKYCLLDEEPLIISMVQEFYLGLKYSEASKLSYVMCSFVKVRGVKVSVTEMSICQIYDTPYYYRVYLNKTKLKEFRNIDIKEILRFLT